MHSGPYMSILTFCRRFFPEGMDILLQLAEEGCYVMRQLARRLYLRVLAQTGFDFIDIYLVLYCRRNAG